MEEGYKVAVESRNKTGDEKTVRKKKKNRT
jgi:hypothetical protein